MTASKVADRKLHCALRVELQTGDANHLLMGKQLLVPQEREQHRVGAHSKHVQKGHGHEQRAYENHTTRVFVAIDWTLAVLFELGLGGQVHVAQYGVCRGNCDDGDVFQQKCCGPALEGTRLLFNPEGLPCKDLIVCALRSALCDLDLNKSLVSRSRKLSLSAYHTSGYGIDFSSSAA